MANLFVKKLIFLIKEKVNSGELPVTFICDVLSMGKEAAYRRLRGEIPFTFDEVIKIAQRLEVSLDEMADMSKSSSNSKWVTFDAGILTSSSSNHRELYFGNLAKFSNIFNEMSRSNNSIIRYAGDIPYFFLMRFEKLYLFKYYQSEYLSQGCNRDFSFGKLILSPDLVGIGKKYIEVARKIPRMLIILDRNIFANFVTNINYFFEENLISEKEFQQLKAELLDLLVFLEKITEAGMDEDGNEINIYLSNVALGSSYLHIENGEDQYAVNVVYFIDILVNQNSRMCQQQKKWIELLKRFSTLITQTGEKQRFEFFRRQRELIESL